jgi:hypothetical protein
LNQKRIYQLATTMPQPHKKTFLLATIHRLQDSAFHLLLCLPRRLPCPNIMVDRERGQSICLRFLVIRSLMSRLRKKMVGIEMLEGQRSQALNYMQILRSSSEDVACRKMRQTMGAFSVLLILQK